jgi:hypothetical protein
MLNQPCAFTKLAKLSLCLPVLLAGQAAWAQTQADPKHTGELSFAVTYTAALPTTTFWLQGGSAELAASLKHGFGVAANITGIHSHIGNDIPVSIVAVTFGPSLQWKAPTKGRPVMLFGHGLIGEANQFYGLNPQPNGPSPSSNCLAINLGGAADLAITPHIGLRLVEASWLRTQFPNAADNRQNYLTLSAGMVFHTH